MPAGSQPPPRHKALNELLQALAGETAELAACADQLQALLGQLMAEPAAWPHHAVERAQTLDSLVQRLQGLHAFLADLGSRTLHDLPAEAAGAASNLRLTSQANRFSPAAPAARALEETGDCHLF